MLKRLLLICFLLASPLWATVRYISPSGSDANAGTSSGAPFKTFAHAIPLLNAGDTLYLLDAIYNGSNSGYPVIDCSSGAHNGVSGSPVTIQALNERQAFLSSNGNANAFYMNHCSYWNIIGLHAEAADLNVGNTFTGDPYIIQNSSHLVIRRNVGAKPNRYGNLHSFEFAGLTNSLVEENEAYYCHRSCFLFFGGSSNNEIRRNYMNNRNYADIAGGYPAGGGFGIHVYSGSNGNIIENNICEQNPSGQTWYCFNIENDSSSNTWLGNISYGNGVYAGFRIGPHSGGSEPIGNVYNNNVAVSPSYAFMWQRSAKATYDHDSAFGTSGSNGFVSDVDSCCTYGSYIFSVTNSTAQNTTGTAYLVTNVSGNTITFDHDNCFSAGTCYNPSVATNANSSNPAFGSCRLWVPDASPLKGAGSSGDIGANVLYQYVAGSLTGNKLWDATTGAPLFAGAIVTAINNVAGSSLFDIANRLNINKNGCAFPSAYVGSVSSPNPPTGLTAIIN